MLCLLTAALWSPSRFKVVLFASGTMWDKSPMADVELTIPLFRYFKCYGWEVLVYEDDKRCRSN